MFLHIYILNIWFVNTFCRYTDDQTILFLTIQFGLSQKSLTVPIIPTYN